MTRIINNIEVIVHKGDGPLSEPSPCPVCGKMFAARLSKIRIGMGKYCSQQCGGKMSRVKFSSPESTKMQRIMARSLVYERIKNGHFVRPTACENCGNRGRVEAHHPDYSRKDFVIFVCRSCHLKCHHRPELAREFSEKARKLPSIPPLGRKITASVASEIKRLLAKGTPGTEISAKYGVSTSLVSRIRVGKLWKSVA